VAVKVAVKKTRALAGVLGHKKASSFSFWLGVALAAATDWRKQLSALALVG